MTKATVVGIGIAAVLSTVAALVSVAAERHVVGQKDKKFTVEALTIKAGETVDFRNDDPFFHNVYSLSDQKPFDLGSYPQGEAKSVTFEEPGKFDVECAIHPTMFMTITVE